MELPLPPNTPGGNSGNNRQSHMQGQRPPSVPQRADLPQDTEIMDMAQAADLRMAVQTLDRTQLITELSQLSDQQIRDILFGGKICYPSNDSIKHLRGWFATRLRTNNVKMAHSDIIENVRKCITRINHMRGNPVKPGPEELTKFANTWFMHNIAFDVDRLGIHCSNTHKHRTAKFKIPYIVLIYRIALSFVTLPFLADGRGVMVPIRYDPFSRAICLIRDSIPKSTWHDKVRPAVRETWGFNVDDLIGRAKAIGLFPDIESAVYADPVPKVLGYGEPFSEITMPFGMQGRWFNIVCVVCDRMRRENKERTQGKKRTRDANEADEHRISNDGSQVADTVSTHTGFTQYTAVPAVPGTSRSSAIDLDAAQHNSRMLESQDRNRITGENKKRARNTNEADKYRFSNNRNQIADTISTHTDFTRYTAVPAVPGTSRSSTIDQNAAQHNSSTLESQDRNSNVTSERYPLYLMTPAIPAAQHLCLQDGLNNHSPASPLLPPSAFYKEPSSMFEDDSDLQTWLSGDGSFPTGQENSNGTGPGSSVTTTPAYPEHNVAEDVWFSNAR